MAVSMKEILVELFNDPELMARFKADPKAVLREKGAEVPEDITFQVVTEVASVEEFEERLSNSGIIGAPL